jgi:hypothetical protein
MCPLSFFPRPEPFCSVSSHDSVAPCPHRESCFFTLFLWQVFTLFRFLAGRRGMTHSADPTGGGVATTSPLLDSHQHHLTANNRINSGAGKGGTGRSPTKGAGLSRSDSYRRARPLLSPAEARKVFRNSADVSSLDFSQCSLSATLTTEDDEDDRREERKEAKGGGGFFRNLRSQFSFSSLRRKSPKKPPLAAGPSHTAAAVAASNNNLSDMSVANFSPELHGSAGGNRPRMTSTPVGGCSGGGRQVSEPRMTSTPLSTCTDESSVAGRLSAEPPRRTSSPNALSCAAVKGGTGTRRPSEPHEGSKRRPEAHSAVARSAGGSSGEPPAAGVKFRTAALKNQYQRWSFAEQSLREGKTFPTKLTWKSPKLRLEGCVWHLG